MKAAYVTGNRQISVVERPEPRIENEHQVKIRVIAGAVCNTTDNKVFATDTPEKSWPNLPFPFIIGHECTGIVVEKGDAVHHLAIGDKVVYWTVDGQAFADYVILDTAKAVVGKINKDVPDDLCAIMEMVIGSTRLLYKPDGTPLINRGDKVVLLGLGPAGLIYAKVALLMGAERVAAYGRRKIRLDTALKLGACAAVNADEPDAIERTLAALGGQADVAIDATGGDVIREIIALSRPGTKAITYGIPPFNWSERLHELTDQGIERYTDTRESAQHALRHCIAWAESGQLDLMPIITHRMPIERVGEALDLCREDRDHTLKIVIRINPN